MKTAILLLSVCVFMIFGFKYIVSGDDFSNIRLKSEITGVQPMTGIVLWEELDNKDTDAIQLEYSYMRYNDVVNEKGVYDWTIVERKLNATASRSHQAVLRFSMMLMSL